MSRPSEPEQPNTRPTPATAPTPQSKPATISAPKPTAAEKPFAFELMQSLRIQMIGGDARWYLWSRQSPGHDQSLSSKAVAQLLMKEARGPTTEPTALSDYSTQAAKFVDSLFLPGGWSSGFINEKPLEITKHKGKKCLLVGTIGVDDVYNTIRLDAKERAASAVTRYVLKAAGHFADEFRDTDVDLVALVIAYGSRDFINDREGRAKGETVAVVASRQDCEAFDSARITDQEFLDRSEIYLSDSDSRSMRKVRLNAQ